MSEVKQIGNIVDTGNWDNPQRGRIYSADGICPALNTVGGGGLEPKIIEDFYKNREPRVYDETAPTIRAEREGLKVIVASRGRNPENPSDRKQGIELEQRLEPNSEGICNTLTSVQKDNLVLEPSILTPKRTEYGKAIRKDYENGKIQESRHNMTELQPREDGISNTLTTVQKDNLVLEPKVVQAVGDRGNHSYSVKDTAFTIPANPMSDRGQMVLEPKLVGGLGEKDWGKQWRQGNRVYDSEAIAMALQAQPVGNAGGNSYLYKTDYRIRKLTPKECAKLMKFSDEDANKMLEVNSNTQVYKQCGNSIVVSVLEAIFCQMNINGCPTWEERAKEEYL